jgi:hypothetical protein
MRKILELAIALTVLACSHAIAFAAAIAVPPGLNPGDTYRIIFVTSTGRDALSPDIAGYNAFVTAAANSDAGLASLGATWKALASTAAVNVLTNAGLSAGDLTTRFYNAAGNLM